MKELTFEEFNERTAAISEARKIFIKSGITNNISVAFELYQEILADKEWSVFISTKEGGHREQTVMDRYERPKCPECGAAMMFRKVPENAEQIKVQLVCSNPECDIVLNSENDLNWWRKELRVKSGHSGTP